MITHRRAVVQNMPDEGIIEGYPEQETTKHADQQHQDCAA